MATPNVFLSILGWLGIASTVAAAQSSTSLRVFDADARTPVAAAVIRTYDPNQAVLTDSAGRAVVNMGKRDSTTVEISRLGYAKLVFIYRRVDGDTLSIFLTPLPVEMAAVNAIVKRMGRSHERSGSALRTYGPDELAKAVGNVQDFYRHRAGLILEPCGRQSLCNVRTGRPTPVYLCVDELLVPSSFMDMFYPAEFEHAEVSRSMIRLYSAQYLDRLARTNRLPGNCSGSGGAF